MRLLAIKLHYFFFFGSVAPVFPFMMVIALQLGAPVVVMGAVNALFLCMIVLLKPLIAACADSFPRYRKHVFISNLIICITAFASVGLLSPFTDDSLAIYARIANETTAAISAPEAFDKKYFENFRNTSFMLSTPSVELNAPVVKSSSCCRILSCDGATSQQHSQNDLQTCLKLSLVSYLLYEKNSTIFNSSISFIKSNSVESILDPSGSMLVSLLYELQLPLAELNGLENVRLDCKEDVTNSTTLSSTLESFNHHIVDQDSSLYQSQLTSSTSVPCSHNEASSNSSVWLIPQFYLFCILMLTATLCYSTTNSITDAICIDSIGVDGDYGSQRAWGSVSWSLVGLTTGFLVDWCSDGAVKDYTPAFLLTLLLGTIDIAIASLTLKVPRLEYKPAVWENVKPLMRQRHVTFFLLFVIMNGCMDGIVANYIFVLQEEIAEGSPAMANIKLLQGLTLLVQGGTEIPAMFLCDRLTKKYGADRLTTIVFGAYAVRLITLGVTALTGHPWLTLLAESLNGPCYGLGYTAIVIYTGHISTPGTSATIQSVVNICYEAIGYGLSSLIGGALFRSVGGAYNYLIFGVVSLITCPLHYLFTKYYPTSRKDSHVKTAEEDSTEATPMQLTQSDKN